MTIVFIKTLVFGQPRSLQWRNFALALSDTLLNCSLFGSSTFPKRLNAPTLRCTNVVVGRGPPPPHYSFRNWLRTHPCAHLHAVLSLFARHGVLSLSQPTRAYTPPSPRVAATTDHSIRHAELQSMTGDTQVGRFCTYMIVICLMHGTAVGGCSATDSTGSAPLLCSHSL